MKSNNETKGSARQHPSYSALCSLPTGATIKKAAAEAQGFTVLGVSVAAEPAKGPSRPLPASLAAVPPRPVAFPIPAAMVADKAHMAALVEMTAQGTEAEMECLEAIRAGTTPEKYRPTVAARFILDAMATSRGR